MKAVKIYNGIAVKIAKMEKEITNYASSLKEEKKSDDIFVEITGYDFTRDVVNFSITLKTKDDFDEIKYTYVQCIAIYLDFSNEVNIEVLDWDTDHVSNFGRTSYKPKKHSFAQCIENF